MTEQRISVTAVICSDPPPGRSALDGYQHIGTTDASHIVHDYYERSGRPKRGSRKYKQRASRDR